MRHLQINTRPQRRGAEVFGQQLAAELRRRGHEAHNAYLYEAPAGNPLELTSKDIRLGGRADSPFEKLPGFHPRLLHRLRRHLRTFRPHVVQLNGSRSVKYGALLRTLGAVPSLLVYRSIGDPAAWSGRRLRQWLYAQLVVHRMDGIVAVSENTRRSLEACYRPRVPISVTPRGIDTAALQPTESRAATRERLATSENATVLLALGSLSAEKRPVWVCESLKTLLHDDASVVLWFVGEGPQRARVQEWAQEHELEAQIRAPGASSTVGNELQACDLLLLGSATEGSPGVVIEAASVGRTCVATDVGGVRDLVDHGETGLVIDPDSPQAFSGAVQRLLDRGCREALAEQARQRAERFSIHHIAERLEHFYDALGESRR